MSDKSGKTVSIDGIGAFFLADWGHAYDLRGGRPELLTLHPKTGKMVHQSSVRWPDDYPPEEVARNLRKWYGADAKKRAAALGAWEAVMLLEERHQ